MSQPPDIERACVRRPGAAGRAGVRPGHLAAVALTASLCAAPVLAERLLIRTYSVDDGLPADQVACLVTDRAGFFWICTNNGLARFDGSRFVTFGTAHGLPDPVINHFLHDSHGHRWVATNGGGVARLEAGTPKSDARVFTSFRVGTTARSMRVNVLFESADGGLFAGTDGGLFRAGAADPQPVFEPVSLGLQGYPDGGLQIWALAVDGAGRLWVGTSGGLVLLRDNAPPLHIAVNPAQSADHIFSILPDTAGRLWLGHDAGLFVWLPPAVIPDVMTRTTLLAQARLCVPGSNADAPAVLPQADGAVCQWVPAGRSNSRIGISGVTTTQDGWIWVMSHASLVAFDGVRFRRFQTGDALPASGTQRIGVDPGGDIWMGAANGAHRILRRGFAQYTSDDGLPSELIQRIQRGTDGHLYVVTANSSLVRLDGDRWTSIQPRLPPLAGVAGRSRYGAALLDHTGAWWIGTGVGLLRYPTVQRLEDMASAVPLAHYTVADGLAGDDVWNIYEDARGDIWIATRVPGEEPLTRWERNTGQFHRYGAADGLPAATAVRTFAEDHRGALWAGLWDGGFARFDGRRFHYVEPGVDAPPGPRYQMVLDRQGWLWAGGREVVFSRDAAAARPHFETFRSTEGETITSRWLTLDGDGWILAATPSGLVRLHGDGRTQQLGTGRPFAGVEQPLHADPDGTLWLAREDHILRYTPVAPTRSAPPPVWIGGVRVAGEPISLPPMGVTSLSNIRLAPGQRQLQIDWFALGFGLDERVRYQFRLDNVDDGWSSPTTELGVVYAGLGPGRYRFQVRALNAANEASAEPATLAFDVTPPFYRRAWFGLLLATSLAALLVAIHRVRLARALELERVRSRIAADLHDEVGASLARVSLMSEATRRMLRSTPDAAETMLEEIGETSRSMVTAVGDVAFCIDPGRGGLAAFTARVRRFGEELLAGTGTAWTLRVHGDTSGIMLTSDQRRHLLAMVKEALHNAVKHAHARRITLDLAVQAGSLLLTLHDDGAGFSMHGDAEEVHAGNGMRNLRHRAAELGGHVAITSPTGAGTRVVIDVPLDGASRMSMQ
jgi:signal transduction histidine kinase/ligand-binding sensor domain-containing protein